MAHIRRSSDSVRLAVLVFLVAFFSCGLAMSSGRGNASEARDPLALIDSLLTVSRFDSVLVMAPALIDEALSENDSTRYGRLLTARGRAELATLYDLDMAL